MEPSPYLPTTRRFVNPIYLRVEDIREVGLPAGHRAGARRVAGRGDAGAATPTRASSTGTPSGRPSGPPWRAVFGQPRTRGPAGGRSRPFCAREGEGLTRLRHLVRAGRAVRPADRRAGRAHAPRPAPARGRAEREELADRVEFYTWLQWCLDEQLATAQRAALDAGMPIGIVHDLAVGVHPDGADAWALRRRAGPRRHRRRAAGRVQPAGPGLVPAAVAAGPAGRARATRRTGTCCAPCCGTPAGCGSTTSSGCSGCGGCRAGPAAGRGHLRPLRPRGAGRHPRPGGAPRRRVRGRRGPRHGRAVGARLPARARHARHLDPVVREGRTRAGRCRPERWRELCLATVTTHDLPPTAGYLAGEHVELRDRLGLLTRPAEEERAATRPTGPPILGLLRELGPARRRRRPSGTWSRRCTAS